MNLMECNNCKYDEFEHEIMDTKYRYLEYFDVYVREDTVRFKCKKCGEEFIEIF